MSVETVKAYFRQFGMEDRILEMEESTATVALAAQTIDSGNAYKKMEEFVQLTNC